MPEAIQPACFSLHQRRIVFANAHVVGTVPARSAAFCSDFLSSVVSLRQYSAHNACHFFFVAVDLL